MKTIERVLPNNSDISIFIKIERSELDYSLEHDSDDAKNIKKLITLGYPIAWSKVIVTAYYDENPDVAFTVYEDGVSTDLSVDQYVDSDESINIIEQAVEGLREQLLNEAKRLISLYNSCNEYLELGEDEDKEIIA